MPVCGEDDIFVKKECTRFFDCLYDEKISDLFVYLTLLDVVETGNGNISSRTPEVIEICALFEGESKMIEKTYINGNSYNSQ